MFGGQRKWLYGFTAITFVWLCILIFDVDVKSWMPAFVVGTNERFTKSGPPSAIVNESFNYLSSIHDLDSNEYQTNSNNFPSSTYNAQAADLPKNHNITPLFLQSSMTTSTAPISEPSSLIITTPLLLTGSSKKGTISLPLPSTLTEPISLMPTAAITFSRNSLPMTSPLSAGNTLSMHAPSPNITPETLQTTLQKSPAKGDELSSLSNTEILMTTPTITFSGYPMPLTSLPSTNITSSLHQPPTIITLKPTIPQKSDLKHSEPSLLSNTVLLITTPTITLPGNLIPLTSLPPTPEVSLMTQTQFPLPLISSITRLSTQSALPLKASNTLGTSLPLTITSPYVLPSTISSKPLPVATQQADIPKYKNQSTHVANASYSLDLPGCKMKYYNPFDAEVKPFYEKKEQFNCGTSFIFQNGTILKLDKDGMSAKWGVPKANIACHLFEIQRTRNGSSDNTYAKIFLQEISSDYYNATQDFLEVVCQDNAENILYDDLFAFIHPKEAVEQRCEAAMKSRKTRDKAKQKFSVAFIGIDSVSHRNFLRHFNKTYGELKEHFDPIEFNGYTKLGLNTFPSLIPLFSGKSRNELNLGSGPYDNLPFIWKNFSNLGYRTLFAEDWPEVAIFHYLAKGFYFQPTDYYLRPYSLAARDSKMMKLGKAYCFNSRLEFFVPIQWCKELLTVFSDKPVFSFSFMTRLTHDYLNYAGYADIPVYEFLQWYRTSAARNNTFLILFSDHGIRWGGFRKTDMGSQEDNLPFFFLLIPPWFSSEYPILYDNLKINQNRLMTMYDVHEMLLDILNFTGIPRTIRPNAMPRGISLFDKIPVERTCDDAGIEPEYCACQERKHVATGSPRSIGVAEILVHAINNETKTERKKCSVLQLQQITSVNLYQVTKRLSPKELRTMDSYKLKVQTFPGGGLFEAVILCELNSISACAVAGHIDRINKYGNQSICINNPVMRNYCYCK